MKKSVLLFSGMLCLVFLTPLVFPPSRTSAENPADQRIAIIFVSPNLGPWDRIVAAPRIALERGYLKAQGYDTEVIRASADNIMKAVTIQRVKAISYFGHAAYPSMENLDAASWRLKVSQFLQEKYSKQGLSPQEAFQRAKAESQNFGLELVRNHSCHSLMSTSLAHQFVKPGGAYHGVKASSYVVCPSPLMMLEDVSFFLDEYKVPGPSQAEPPQNPPPTGRSYTAQPRPGQ